MNCNRWLLLCEIRNGQALSAVSGITMGRSLSRFSYALLYEGAKIGGY